MIMKLVFRLAYGKVAQFVLGTIWIRDTLHMPDDGLVARALQFHPWDAMAPAALEAIAARGPFQSSAETGCGGSTILLSHLSGHHTAFPFEGADHTVTGLRHHPDFQSDTVIFVEGDTRRTVPAHSFDRPLDLVLLDGPHAYPLPQLEFVYLFPELRTGGWMVLDDIQIPSVHELFRFLRREPSLVLEEIAVRTAFFRKVDQPDWGIDGWQHQGINRSTILRYSWRDRLRRLLQRNPRNARP